MLFVSHALRTLRCVVASYVLRVHITYTYAQADARKIIIYVRDVFDVSNLHLISFFFFENIMKYVSRIPSRSVCAMCDMRVRECVRPAPT